MVSKAKDRYRKISGQTQTLTQEEIVQLINDEGIEGAANLLSQLGTVWLRKAGYVK